MAIFNFLIFLFVLATTPLASYAQDPNPNDLPPGNSFSGQIDLHSKDSAEPVGSIQFQVGSDEGLEASGSTAIDDLATIEKTSGDGVIQVYEVEGDPEVQIPSELSSKVQIDRVKIPRDVVEKFNQARNNVSEAWSKIYVKPSQYDRTLGMVFFTIRGAMAATIFFSASNISPELATLMTLSVATATGINNAFHQTLTNAFAYGIKERTTKLGKAYNWSIEYLRSLTYDVLMGDAINAVGGQNSLYQATVNGVFSNAVGSYFSSDRSRMLRIANSKHLNFAYKLLLNPITFLIQAWDNSGQVEPFFTRFGYEFRPTLAATAVIYVILIGLHHNKPTRNFIMKVLNGTYNKATRFLDKASVKVGNACNAILRDRNSEEW